MLLPRDSIVKVKISPPSFCFHAFCILLLFVCVCGKLVNELSRELKMNPHSTTEEKWERTSRGAGWEKLSKGRLSSVCGLEVTGAEALTDGPLIS